MSTQATEMTGAAALTSGEPTTVEATVTIDTGHQIATRDYQAAVAALEPATPEGVEMRGLFVGRPAVVEALGGIAQADANVREAVVTAGFPTLLGKVVADAMADSMSRFVGTTGAQRALGYANLQSQVSRACKQPWADCVRDAKVAVSRIPIATAEKLGEAGAFETPGVWAQFVLQGKRLSGGSH